ncbi:GFA family protein [Mesorhizobium sp.]|uniref:GFA family protein n=1 Tax=Mesorhizobium sp. TaxID=1871066 RepID=UPI0025C3AB54|nr:GFA family protein [Mesorhizobium sp.]
MASPNETQKHQHVTADSSFPLTGSCECGACSFEIQVAPKGRFRCHCLICQGFTGRHFSDVVVVPARHVTLNDASNISFAKYRPPPNFNRGKCRTCGKPVVEVAGVGSLQLMFIPVFNLRPTAPLTPVRADVFYHRRVEDMHYGVPHYSGYWPSQYAITRTIIRSL